MSWVRIPPNPKIKSKVTHKPAIIVLLMGYLLIQSEYRFSFYFVTFDLFSKSRTNTTQVKAPMVIRSFDKLMIFSSVDTFRAPRQLNSYCDFVLYFFS